MSRLAFVWVGGVLLQLVGCGGSGTTAAPAVETFATAITAPSTQLPMAFVPHSDASQSGLQLAASDAGVSPFIQQLSIRGNNLSRLSSVEFTIEPKAGSASSAVDVTYSSSALLARGYLQNNQSVMKLPVFGLYAGYTNGVTLLFNFEDGSSRTLTTSITTADYDDPTGIYQHPSIVKQRIAGTSLGFSFFYVKAGTEAPVIIDTDGEIRWTAPGITYAQSTALQSDEFVIGDPAVAVVRRLRLDGTLTQSPETGDSIVDFHHNIDFGKTGLLADVNTQGATVENIESNVVEMDDQGSVYNHWDLAAIISDYMLSMGDDAAAFVRPGVDWFHNNSTTYDAADDTLIVSSRENFVIKLDYETGKIIWIFGDPTKYWYTFPSLRAKALTVNAGGLYPIGQHALSITPQGNLLMFNDGLNSGNQPANAPPGESRTFSAVSAYSIDENAMTAQTVLDFEDGQTIFSPICSSAYTAPQNSMLVDYATANGMTNAILMGLDASQNIVFEFEYPTTICNTSWNAVPMALESMTIN